jgi:hypothetical protein
MSVYLAGAQAMRCVAGVARGVASPQVKSAFATLSNAKSNANLRSFRALSQEATDPLSVSVLAAVAATQESVPNQLRDAIDQINTKIVTTAANKSIGKNPTQIVSDLKNSIKSDQQLQQQTPKAVQSLVADQKFTAEQASEFLAAPATGAILTFNSDLPACIAKAG